jgi:DNA topoisomerase-1
VEKVEKKKRHRNPAPPFITSTLQQEAARKLRFSAKLTMSVAQKLYEGLELGNEGAVGLITYMRTDSTRLSNDAVQAVRTYVNDVWGKDYLPGRQVVYKTREGAQDAHEAIRPTDVNRTPEAVAAFLSTEQLKLYSLIWKRFVACQMSPAVIAQTTVDIAAGDHTFRAAGSVIEFPGFMTLYVESQENGDGDEDEGILPDLAEGQTLSLLDLNGDQHFTQPPPRFSEASLIKELEELGIGRPSTYASILSTILDREYVVLNKQRLFVSELGWIINELLVENFPSIMDVEFTANMERSLDEIERGKHNYPSLLSGFYDHFAKTLESAKDNMLDMKRDGWPIDEKCPLCQRPLHIRWSRNGPFVACSAYPECQFSSDYERDERGAIHLVKDQDTGEVCDKCGRPMLLKKGRFGVFLACSGYPECKNTRARGSGLRCPAEGCDGELVERVARGGRRFFGCNRYPECKIAFSGQPVRKKCPGCGAVFLVQKENRRSGTKLVCANPECRYEENVEANSETDEAKVQE